MRFLQAFAAMVAIAIQTLIELAQAGLNAATSCLDAISEAVRRLFGGGGSASAEPIPNLEAALPDESRIDEARDLEKGKAAAADVILKQSPELQAKMFALMNEDDRLQADLTLLTPDQTAWLIDLSDAQLKAVAEASDRRVAAALSGEPNALSAIRSVGQPEPEDTTGLAHRIAAKRAATFATAPIMMSGYMH